jgi:NAD-specific glutamate dehydrogenase
MTYAFTSSSILTLGHISIFCDFRGASHSHIVLFVVEFGQIVDHTLVEILSSQMGIAGRCEDFEYTVLDLEKRHVKGASA